MPNQFPEHIARDKIDALLIQSGWIIQERTKINLNAGSGIAVKEYLTDVGPADYVLFVNKEAIGVIEAKRAEEGVRLSDHEFQTEGYASAKLKYLNIEKLHYGYESTGELTRFTDYRDPKPRSRPVFTGINGGATQRQIAELFQTTSQNITLHLKKLNSEKEVDTISTCKEYLQVQLEGKRKVERKQHFYNRDAIISVGYRVNSNRGTQRL